MGWVTGTVVFILAWWIIFYMTLPFGINPNGCESGAPKRPALGMKIFITTLLTSVVWAFIRYLIGSEWINLRD